MSKTTNLPNDMHVGTLPGISAYGQDGPAGLKGENGNRTYFSIYTDQNVLGNHISMNKSLDGNESKVIYNENDIVIDTDGNIWKIFSGKRIIFLKSLFNSSVNISFTIEEVDNDDVAHPALIENPYFEQPYSKHNSSPWLIHRDRYYPLMPGAWFKITIEDPIPNMNYSCGITLPNGNIIKSNDISSGETPTCYIFIDYRYIMELHLINDDELDIPIDGYANGETHMFDMVKYNGVLDNNECTEAISDECIEIIEKAGIFFVEAESMKTGKIYRKEKRFEA